jgi:flagellar hook-associated protein FlgK
MASVSSTALSGMQAAQTQLNATAHNVANLNTEKFQRQEVVNKERAASNGVTAQVRKASQEGAEPETDMVAQLQAKNAFLMNLSVFKSNDKMAGALLDAKA